MNEAQLHHTRAASIGLGNHHLRNHRADRIGHRERPGQGQSDLSARDKEIRGPLEHCTETLPEAEEGGKRSSKSRGHLYRIFDPEGTEG